MITSRLGGGSATFGSVRGQSSCGGAQGGKPQIGPPCPRSPRLGALPRSSTSRSGGMVAGASDHRQHDIDETLHRGPQDLVALGVNRTSMKATKLDPPTELPLLTVELKWRGYMRPNAHILPQTTRDFDAFLIFHDRPETLLFQSFTDASDFMAPITGAGRYELRYVVVSDNFLPARGVLALDLSSSLASTVLALRPEKRARFAELPTHDAPWDGSVSLRRENMYDDDGR